VQQRCHLVRLTTSGVVPPGQVADLDGALRSIFEDLGHPEDSPAEAPRAPASALFRKIEREMAADVFRSGTMGGSVVGRDGRSSGCPVASRASAAAMTSPGVTADRQA